MIPKCILDVYLMQILDICPTSGFFNAAVNIFSIKFCTLINVPSPTIFPLLMHHSSDQDNFLFRTKEETEAAHDLLSLSRSLPPLPCPGALALRPEGAHTPPDQEEQHHYTTLIYISPPGQVKAGGRAIAQLLKKKS